MLRKASIILAMLIMVSATVVCNLGGAAPADEPGAAAVDSPLPPTPEPTEPPVEEDIERVATPTPVPTPAPEPTPTEAIIAALTAQEAYDLTLAAAQGWQSDAVLTEMQTSLLGPLDATGYSESWSAFYWSPTAKALNSMIFVNGALNSSTVPLPLAQRAIPALDRVIMDTNSLYETAASAGGVDYINEGYRVSAGLTPYPLDEDIPTWYIHYQDPADNTVAFSVIIDARSGEVIQAIAVGETTNSTGEAATAAGDVDLTNPVAVVQAVFAAADTGEFDTLPGLCDPVGENDDDTQLICNLATNAANRGSFVESFATGRIAGGVQLSEDGSQIEIGFLFGPDGQREETMTLINRNGKWYLFSF